MEREGINCEVLDLRFFTAAVMKNSVFWDVTPYRQFIFERRFGGTYRLHLQGRRIREARTQHVVVTCSEILILGMSVLEATHFLKPHQT
jgi:hypothetical protein